MGSPPWFGRPWFAVDERREGREGEREKPRGKCGDSTPWSCSLRARAVVCPPGHGQVGIRHAAYNPDRDTTCRRYCMSSTLRPQYLVAAYAPAESGGRDGEDSAAPRTGPRSQITAVEGMKALRQATKLWQEELDPEFGRSSKNIGAWLQKAKQARQCEPRAVPLHEARADLPPWGALLGGAP